MAMVLVRFMGARARGPDGFREDSIRGLPRQPEFVKFFTSLPGVGLRKPRQLGLAAPL